MTNSYVSYKDFDKIDITQSFMLESNSFSNNKSQHCNTDNVTRLHDHRLNLSFDQFNTDIDTNRSCSFKVDPKLAETLKESVGSNVRVKIVCNSSFELKIVDVEILDK